MLFGEQRGRREHRDLHAVGDGDERGSQCYLRLSEAHVAAHQAIHGLAAFHVFERRDDRRRLVGSLLESEAFGEGLVVVLVELEGMAFAGGAPVVEVEELGGGVAHRARGAALGLLPLVAAQLVQRRLLRRPA